jgi:hypothetical protein
VIEAVALFRAAACNSIPPDDDLRGRRRAAELVGRGRGDRIDAVGRDRGNARRPRVNGNTGGRVEIAVDVDERPRPEDVRSMCAAGGPRLSMTVMIRIGWPGEKATSGRPTASVA